MAAPFSSPPYNRLVSVMSLLASGNLLKCCSLSVCSVCKLPAYYALFQASVTGQPVGPIFGP